MKKREEENLETIKYILKDNQNSNSAFFNFISEKYMTIKDFLETSYNQFNRTHNRILLHESTVNETLIDLNDQNNQIFNHSISNFNDLSIYFGESFKDLSDKGLICVIVISIVLAIFFIIVSFCVCCGIPCYLCKLKRDLSKNNADIVRLINECKTTLSTNYIEQGMQLKVDSSPKNVGVKETLVDLQNPDENIIATAEVHQKKDEKDGEKGEEKDSVKIEFQAQEAKTSLKRSNTPPLNSSPSSPSTPPKKRSTRVSFLRRNTKKSYDIEMAEFQNK